MIQHGLERIYNVNNNKSLDLRVSSKLPSATSIEFFFFFLEIFSNPNLKAFEIIKKTRKIVRKHWGDIVLESPKDK